MRVFPIVLVVAITACSTSQLPTDPAPPAPTIVKQFHYPHGDLVSAKPPGTGLRHVDAAGLGAQGTTCGASIAAEWQGINSNASDCSGCNPPDGSIAVGPSDVVSAVNTALEVWNKSGTVLSGPTNLQTLMAPSGDTLTGFSDPGVLYDATADRYVIYIVNYNAAETSSTLNVAVSTSNDPTSTWTLYTFAMPTGDLFDFPHGAINGASGSEVLYVTGNLFAGPSTFVSAYAVALNLTQMYAGTTPTPVTQTVGNNASGVKADTLMPAQNDSATNVMYFLSADNQKGNGNSKISLFRWSDPLNTNSFTLQGGVTVTSYAQPPNPLEYPGGFTYVNTNDARDLATVYYSGSLYGAHSVGVTAGGAATAAVQWYEIGNIDGTPTLTQQGTNATADAYRWMPSIAVDGSGDLVMSYSYTNGGYIGTRLTARYAGTTSGALLGETDVIDGASAGIDDSRWGDFGTMVFDGTDFWQVGEYENGTGTGGWATYVEATALGTTAAFDLQLTPSWQDAIKGQNTTWTVSTDVCNGYSGTINLSASSLPTGATASFNPTSVSGGGSSTMTFHPATTTSTGIYTLDVTGTDSTGTPIESSVEAFANVVPSDFTVSASPSSGSVSRGSSISFTATFTSISSYAGSLLVWQNGEPPSTSSSWSTDPVVLRAGRHASSTWKLNTTSSTPTGTYTIELRGVDANTNLDHAAMVTVTVN